LLRGTTIQVTGISPFSAATDSVSRYSTDVDYLQDTLLNFRKFDLPQPRLLRAFSTDQVAVELITSQPWDLIYIDGNHDYEVVQKDWQVCSQSVKPGGVIVLDDAGLTTSYRPPSFATKGHPGPSRVAAEINRTCFKEILQVGHNRAFQRIP
jgi:predicted O-methyltransferase YrrM